MAHDAFKKSCGGTCSCSDNAGGCKCGGSCSCGSKKSDKKRGYLKLEFSKAADYDRINVFFDPTVKQATDPSQYITKRREAAFRRSINDGCAAFLSDQDGNVMTLAVNYQVHMDNNHPPGAQHDYTELATTMSRLTGYHNAHAVTAALALSEWWLHPPKHLMITSIEKTNIAPQKIAAAMGWEKITDPVLTEYLFNPVYKTVVDETGQNRDIPLPPKDYMEQVLFFTFAEKSLALKAGILLQFMDAGCVTNKKTNHSIPLDLSALDTIGLTRPRLEALAKGVTSREALKKIAP